MTENTAVRAGTVTITDDISGQSHELPIFGGTAGNKVIIESVVVLR